MVCCRCCGFDEFFDERTAAKELRRYRRKGPIASTRLLIELLEAEDVSGASLLDVGGGIGAIQHELIKAGVTAALDVDGSPAYLAAARSEAERQGHVERVAFKLGDFVDLAGSIDDADVVTLDRVICCYPDLPRLLASSATRARRLYGLVFPRRTLPMRIARPLVNTWNKVRRRPLRFFLHDADEVERLARAAGLAPHARRRTWLWQVVVYRRERRVHPADQAAPRGAG